eukprot:COSAG01_NODE_218_length_21548_cov_7.916919_7_plen_69_part_00
MWNWNATYPYPHPKTIEPYWLGVLGSDQDPQPSLPYPHGICKNTSCPASGVSPWQGAINHCIGTLLTF